MPGLLASRAVFGAVAPAGMGGGGVIKSMAAGNQQLRRQMSGWADLVGGTGMGGTCVVGSPRAGSHLAL